MLQDRKPRVEDHAVGVGLWSEHVIWVCLGKCFVDGIAPCIVSFNQHKDVWIMFFNARNALAIVSVVLKNICYQDLQGRQIAIVGLHLSGGESGIAPDFGEEEDLIRCQRDKGEDVYRPLSIHHE